jgi:hypothetical protein
MVERKARPRYAEEGATHACLGRGKSGVSRKVRPRSVEEGEILETKVRS